MTLTDILLISLAFFVLIWISTFVNRKRNYLVKSGIPASATVVAISKTGAEIGSGFGARPLMNIVLTFELNGVSKRVVIDQDLDTRDIPKVGDRVNIRIHPKDHKNVLTV